MNISNLHIGYKKTLLEIQELNLESGKIYALIGANGRGKTTLMKTLIGQIAYLSGQIELTGKEISMFSNSQKSTLFGFVNSRFSGISFMKAEEFVALGRSPYTNAIGRLKKEDNLIIQNSFKTLEIEHLKGKFTSELSDGERQLLAIAKVLAQQTKYIFLDEPTAFLDYTNKKRVMEMLAKIANQENKCILYSSHDLEMAIEYSNSLVCIPKERNQIEFLKKPTALETIVSLSF